jgi:hypothetical protein
MATDELGNDLTDDLPDARRDRREHGGSGRVDDDALAERTEDERVEVGLADYNPDTVPPATDVEPTYDPAEDEALQEERGMFRRQEAEGEIYPITKDNPFPPTRYEE